MIKTFEVTRGGQPVGTAEASIVAGRATKNIREYMNAGIFKSPTGKLRDSILAYALGNMVYIKSNLEYADEQNDGVKPHIMWYLLGKTIPVTINGQTVYRKATISSFLKGSWRHKGTQGKKFVEVGVEMTRGELNDVEITKR